MYRTKDRIRAELMKDKLEEHGIVTVIINKQDSSYLMFGELEVHVPVDKIMEANKIINDDNSTE